MSVSEVVAELEVLEEALDNEPARKLFKYVTRAGNYRGEIRYFTPKQYREITGKIPKASIKNKEGKIPWELALDDITTELGYSSDGELKRAIERVRKMELRKDDLQHELGIAKEQAREGVKCAPITNTETGCMSPIADKCKAKFTQCKGAEVIGVRQPSQWNIHVTKAGSDISNKTQVGEVRYAREANRSIKDIVVGMEDEHSTQRKVQKKRKAQYQKKKALSGLATVRR